MSLLFLIIFGTGIGSALSYEFEDLDLSENEIKHYMETKFLGSLTSDSNENIFTPYFFGTGVGNRENLYINDISVDQSFVFGKDVIDWKEITFGGRQYLIGRQTQSVILIRIKIKHFTSERFNTLYFNQTVMSFDGIIGPIAVMEHINYTSGTKEGFALVTESKNGNFQDIHWLKITKTGLVLYDTWSNPTRGEIIDLKWIKHDFNEFLIIITQNMDFTMIDISEYNLQDDKMRLMCRDKLSVDYLLSSVSVVVEGEDLFMVLVAPQQQYVYLYRYHLNFYKAGMFDLLKNFFSPGVTMTNSFIQSGRNYFLINGEQPNIFLLDSNGNFTAQLQNCGAVEEWLVVQVPTFREDVVLLARNHSRVSILTWMGSLQGFLPLAQPPCFAIDSNMNYLSRLSEDAGCVAQCTWTGGATLTLGHIPSLLLVCNSQSNVHHIGGLYHFNVSLHPVLGPAQAISNILSRSHRLQNEVNDLSREFEMEGLLDDIELSKVRLGLEEGHMKNWDNIEQCLDDVEQQMFQLMKYMDQRRQNDIRVNISLHQGRLVGSASGLIGNQSVQTTFKGKMGWLPQSNTFDSTIDVDSEVLFDGNQQYVVKAKLKLDSVEVTDALPIEEVRSQSKINYGVSPEIRGPPSTYVDQNELLLHQRIANGDF